jgi:hypothetical protein
MKKTTIYIDIDDDIAGIAEKIQNAEQKIVALVLPKRPSVLQGSVNMNLLRRTSEESAKNIVLITTDDQVLRLAGQIGVHVSPSLQSKPYVPTPDVAVQPAIEEVSDSIAGDIDPAQPDVYIDDKKVDLKTPIGVLAGTALDDEIELDNEDPVDAKEVDNGVKGTDKKPRRIAVPNFNSFRTKLGLGIGILLLLIGGFYWAFYIAPKASVTISTQKSDSNAKITVTASKDQAVVDADKGLLPATRKEDKQKLTGTFTATGQKDVGTKASGTVTLKNCEDSENSITIPAGTGVSKGQYTFITQTAAVLPAASFSGGGSNCTTPSSKAVDVKVVASNSGDQYNVSAGSYSVAGNFGNIVASGTAMGGGSTKIVKVVSTDDVETAKAKLLEKAADNVKGKVTTLLSNDGLLPVVDTFVSDVGAPVPSIAVGAEAPADVTLTIEITSSMLGVKRTDIDPLLTKEITKKITPSTQKIYSTGSEAAVIAVIERPSADVVKMTVAVTGKIGPNIDQVLLKKDIAGKKAGDAKQLIEARPGVSKADIQLSPFWVFSLPQKSQKINIQINE